MGPKSDSVIDHADYYINTLGWRLCRIKPGTKAPDNLGWNQPSAYITTANQASKALAGGYGIGLIHEPSYTCAVDIDDMESTRLVFSHLEIELDELISIAPQIKGAEGRGKAIFALPPALAVGLDTRKLVWPVKDDPKKGTTIFELRCGAVQDVLPPSIHPHGHPYTWAMAPWDVDVPEIPKELLQVWKYWDEILPQLMAVCPWYVQPERKESPRQTKSQTNLDIIGQFNRSATLESFLNYFGYKRVGLRFLSPSSTSNIPGVIIHDDGTHFFCHHKSDYFGDEHLHDAFDLFKYYNCGGDERLAICRVAEQLNIGNPDYDGIDISAIIAEARAETDDGPAPEEEPSKPSEDSKTPPPLFISDTDLCAAQYPDQPIVRGLLDRKESLLIIGETGIGKSLITLDIAFDLVDPPMRGLWDEFLIPEPVKVLCVQAENSAKIVQSRMKIMGYKPSGNIFFLGPQARKAGSIKDAKFYSELIRAIVLTKAQVVFVDPLISYHSEDENDNAAMRRSLDRFTDIQEQCDVSFVLVHHKGKSANGGVLTGRGASAINDWAANILVVDHDPKDKKIIVMDHVKGRSYETKGPYHFTRGKDLRLVPLSTKDAINQGNFKQAKLAVDALLDAGGNANSAGDFIAIFMKYHNSGRNKARIAIAAAVDLDLIKTTHYDKNRTSYSLAL